MATKLVITKVTDRFVEIVPRFRMSGYHHLKEGTPEVVIIEDTYSAYNELDSNQKVDFINDLKEFYNRQRVVEYEITEGTKDGNPGNPEKVEEVKEPDVPKEPTKSEEPAESKESESTEEVVEESEVEESVKSEDSKSTKKSKVNKTKQ